MMSRFLLFSAGLLLTQGPVGAADDVTKPGMEPEPAKPVTPNVEKLSGSRYRVGKVEFDSKTREIHIPAKVNMNGSAGESPLECLLVRPHGKVHESLFTTDAAALDINLAFTLLRFSPSAELYALPNQTGGLSGEYPKVPQEIQRAARIRIQIEQTTDGTPVKVPVGNWIRHTTKLTAMPESPWVYGGSEFMNGQYLPESTGDLVAILTARASLINYPGEGRDDDNTWQAFPKRVPALETEVILIFSPYYPEPAAKP